MSSQTTSSPPRPLPAPDELAAAYDEIARIHSEHLAQHGVRLPEKGTYKSIWLAMLHHYAPEPVHKDEISDAVRRQYPEAGRDQQVRHLKRDGWNVAGRGGYHRLSDPYRPDQGFINERARRQGRLGADDFTALKTAFGNRCATCGARDGEPDPRYGPDLVVLQQGHQDPDKPADNPENIIPQCQFCNRAYRRDFVFDARGRVRAVADTGPVRRANRDVQRRIWEFLRQSFGKS